MYINHDAKEVRVYNFRKTELTNKEKIDLLYGILEECVLFPNAKRSLQAKRGQIETYVLLVNGYLMDGTFKEPNETYSSIATQFLDETKHYDGEPECSEYLRSKVKSIYEENKEQLGKEVVSFKVTSTSRIKTYYDIINTCILLDAYLKDKGIGTTISVLGNIFAKEREIIIRPKHIRNWG